MSGKNRWMILGASCLINLCIGSVYAWSVFAAPMAEYLSSVTKLTLTPGDLSIAFTVANLLGPLTMISGGKINDTFGPKLVIFAGGILFGAGLLLTGFARNVGTLLLGYGILAGLGLGLAYGCTISNSVKFFPDRRGMAGGLTTASYGLSSVMLPPVANLLIQKTGITMTFRILGIAFALIVCFASFFIEKCPPDFKPEGWEQKNMGARGETAERDWKGMLKSPVFYVMLSTLICGAFCGLMCTSQASSIAQDMIGMSAGAAALSVSVLALFNAAGRIGAGFVSDRIGRSQTLTAACILAAAGLFLLYFCKNGSTGLFYSGISLVGVSFGSFMGVFPGFTADRFGAKHNSVNYGIMFIGFAAAGYFGPAAMRKIYITDGGYQNAFLTAALLAGCGLILTFVYRFMEKRK